MDKAQESSIRQVNDRFALILVAPLLPGKTEAWRRFVQEMVSLRRHEYEASRRRLALTGEWFWLIETKQGDIAVIAVKSIEPERIMNRIATSSLPFDRWFCHQLQTLLDLNINKAPFNQSPELLWSWQRRCP